MDESQYPRSNGRLASQIEFLLEVDQLKGVLRQSYLIDKSRRENSAEHSWHVGLMAMILAEYSPKPVELTRVLKMLLVHDLVEIDAGDTFCYDEQGYLDKEEREEAAARRLFGLLPGDQARELWALWREFEEMETTDALFAASVDRFHPFLHNAFTEGPSWVRNGIRRSQVLERMAPLREAVPALWAYMEQLIENAIGRGLLKP